MPDAEKPVPAVSFAEEPNRIRAYADGKLIATALRSSGRDCEWFGWRVTTVVDSRGAAKETLTGLAENERVAHAVVM